MYKNIILFVVISMFAYANATAGSSSDSYYVGNVAECKYTRYICESGYKSFSNSRGCGCERIFKNYSTRVNYSSINAYNSWYTYSTSAQSQREQSQHIVKTFLSKLESKWYSSSQIVRTIDRVADRLDDIRAKTTKQRNLIKYLQRDLTNYSKNYENSFDEIYEVFEYYY